MSVMHNPGKDDPVEIREKSASVDEIIIRGGNVHIERMSNSGWFMGVEASDGSYWQFWFGTKDGRHRVEFRHTEHVGPDSDDTPSSDRARRS